MIKWITGRRPRFSVFVFYVGLAATMFFIGKIDQGMLGYVGYGAAGAAIIVPFTRNVFVRSALTTIIAFAITGRLGLYVFNTQLATDGAKFTASVLLTVLFGVIALVSTDAELTVIEKLPSLEKLEKLQSAEKDRIDMREDLEDQDREGQVG